MGYKEEDTGIIVLIAIWVMVIISLIIYIKTNTGDFSVYELLGFGILMTLFYLPTYNKTKKIVKNNYDYNNIFCIFLFYHIYGIKTTHI